MSSTPNTSQPSINRRLVASIVTLSLWRWRQQWVLLLMICLGMIAAVTIVCTIPLLSSTMQTAALRSVLRATPGSSEVSLRVQVAGLSTQSIDQTYQLASAPLQPHVAAYMNGQPRLDFQTPLTSIFSPTPPASSDTLGIYGTSMDKAASHVKLIQGRLPQATNTGAEIAVTPETAQLLNLHVGSKLVLNWTIYTGPAGHSVSPAHIPIPIYLHFSMQVVGIFSVQAGDPYWHGYNFLPYTPDSGCCTQYTVLASKQNFLAALDQLANSHGVSQVFFFDQSYLFWYYQLATSRISITQLNDLISQLSTAQAKIADTYSDPYVAYQPPYIQKIDIFGAVIHVPGAPSILETFRSKLAVVQIPILILVLEIIALILLFVGMMTLILVDRQADTIALIRSRGASGGQVFGAFMTQSIVLSLIALIVGPLLAIASVYFITDQLLPPSAQDAVYVISNAPLQALLSIKWYAIGAAIVVIATMAFSLYRASRVDVWSTANQASTSARRPIWQRLNLDLFVAFIALAGFGISVYLTSVEGLLDPQTQTLVVSPLALLAPVFLLLAIVLVFLRSLPVLLQFGSRLVMRGRSATPVLAVAQMARKPRQAVRMILLLGLATAFALFTLVFAASQAQRAQDIAAYQAGADFSGAIPIGARALPIQQEIALYQHIPGVLAASASYVEDDISSVNATAVPIQVQAVDPGTYTQATIWTSNNSSQSLSLLLSQLAAQRSEAIRTTSIPAIVDASTWNTLNLHPGETFNLYKNTATGPPTRYIAVAEVQQFPALDNATGGGIMVDYLSLASIIAAASPDHALVPVNHIWLRTESNPASLASVRTALTTSPLQLDNLLDRRALSEMLGSDPLSLNIIGLLAIGATATLLLALAGSLLISWLSVRRRLTDFVVLRALGATSTQSASVFVWEQGIIYTTALFLGIAFGALLIVTTVPTLVFTNPPGGASSIVNSAQLYELQHIIPPQIVVRPAAGIVLLVLIAISIATLTLMMRSILRPSMSQVLRLEEDRSSALLAREDAIMARFVPRQGTSRTPNRVLRPSYVTLAIWQVRKVWFLLLVQGIGFIAAVTIVCSVPIFSTVATTASLHETLNASADTSTMTLNTSTQGFSSKIYSDVQKQLDPMVEQYIGTYLARPTTSFIQSAGFTLGSAASSSAKDNIQLIGTSMDQISSHLTLVQGQLPQSTVTRGAIESILTPATARKLHLTVGSVITLHGDFFTNPADMFGGTSPQGTVTVHIVGLFNLAPGDTAFWHGEDFLPIQGQQLNSFTLLVPNEAYLSALDQIASAAHQNTVFSPQTFTINWYYHLDTANIAVDQVSALNDKLSLLRASIANTYGSLVTATDAPSYPYIVQVNLYNPVPGSYDISNTLDQFRNRAAIVTIPIAVITLLAFALILFFASLIANLLVDQQAETIAILRSRGASVSQIFGSLLTQSIALGVIALIIGPILAIIFVSLISQHVLGATEQAAINLVTGQPVQALTSVAFYALATVIVVVAAMAFMLWLAARKNALVMRREAARTTQRPIWQRLNLDAVAAVIALMGYGVSLYLVSLNNLFDARTRVLVVAPLTLIAPLFLLIAFLFLFLRFFTALLRLGARLAMQSRGAISMLALAQMARNPRQTLRMTLLLALAIAFAIFTLVFSASQFQHISDMAAYESGADFSGDLPVITQHSTVQQETALYRNIAGVKSATVGLTESGVSTGTTLSIPIEIRAVDAHTFAQTGIWTPQDSSQSLSSLMMQLDAASNNAIHNDQVPVIIDAATANRLELQPGNVFAVIVNDLPNSNLNCEVIAVVQHIPTVNSSDTSGSSGTYVAPGGILLDYSTYAAVYKLDILVAKGLASDTYLPINHVWLSTQNDENSLASVRNALQTPGLRLQNLYDRRLLISTMSSDPLYLSLIIVLTIGSATALLLALVGSLLASWMSVRNRLTSFAVMRALGTAPAQITRVLLWEQVVIYATALFLGIIFGAILSATAVPTLAFTSLSAGGVLSSLTSDEFYVFQRIIPAQVVIPFSLGLAFAALVAICVVALWIMASVTLRPSMSQTLRLNED
jgi:ABC-type antimicrobial peptide transport system permease subunit